MSRRHCRLSSPPQSAGFRPPTPAAVTDGTAHSSLHISIVTTSAAWRSLRSSSSLCNQLRKTAIWAANELVFHVR